MKKVRLIDEIVPTVLEKNIMGDVTHLCMTNTSFQELLNDYSEEFETEFFELGRTPSKSDLQEYLNVKIIIGEVDDGTKFKILKMA